MVQGFIWFKVSIGSRVQLVQGLNWFKGSIVSSDQMVQRFYCTNVSIGSIGFRVFSSFHWFKFLISARDNWLKFSIVLRFIGVRV